MMQVADRRRPRVDVWPRDGRAVWLGWLLVAIVLLMGVRNAKGQCEGWSAVGTGVNGDVYALVVMPNGDVVAGGNFTMAGGVAASRIARWNGASWSPLGVGMNSSVHALVVLPNGDLVAGGGFLTAGDQQVNYIARWDGARWSRLGSGLLSNQSTAVYALALDANTQSTALVIVQPIPSLATGYRCRIEGGCNCGVTYTDTVNFSIACPADFNADGGVDFSDVEAFFERWENGC